MKIRIASVVFAAALAACSGASAGMTLVASGIGEIDPIIGVGLAGFEPYKLTLYHDQTLTNFDFLRTIYVTHYNWDDQTDGWYKDYVLPWQMSCSSSMCTDDFFWDANLVSKVTFSPGRVTMVGLPPRDLGLDPSAPGEDYDELAFETAEVFAFFDQPANWKLYRSEVPEPGTWTLLAAAFGLTGAALRRRRELQRRLPVTASLRG